MSTHEATFSVYYLQIRGRRPELLPGNAGVIQPCLRNPICGYGVLLVFLVGSAGTVTAGSGRVQSNRGLNSGRCWWIGHICG